MKAFFAECELDAAEKWAELKEEIDASKLKSVAGN
jgi:hypothetical protein